MCLRKYRIASAKSYGPAGGQGGVKREREGMEERCGDSVRIYIRGGVKEEGAALALHPSSPPFFSPESEYFPEI